MVVAKTDQAYLSLVKQLKERTVEKTYVALVHGVMKNDRGVIAERIGRHPVHRQKMAVIKTANRSREAVSEYRVLKRLKGYTLVEVKIKTGRTHQVPGPSKLPRPSSGRRSDLWKEKERVRDHRAGAARAKVKFYPSAHRGKG